MYFSSPSSLYIMGISSGILDFNHERVPGFTALICSIPAVSLKWLNSRYCAFRAPGGVTGKIQMHFNLILIE